MLNFPDHFRIMLLGLQAREHEINTATADLKHDEALTIRLLANELGIDPGEIGTKYRIDVKRRLLVSTEDDAHASHAQNDHS